MVVGYDMTWSGIYKTLQTNQAADGSQAISYSQNARSALEAACTGAYSLIIHQLLGSTGHSLGLRLWNDVFNTNDSVQALQHDCKRQLAMKLLAGAGAGAAVQLADFAHLLVLLLLLHLQHPKEIHYLHLDHTQQQQAST